MTLDKLVLENFGAYRNNHEIKLTPPSDEQPIVLFGGLNGSGKTTLLDALQLVLYGKRARCSNRANNSYEEFLRQSINRYADPAGGSKIELWFHHVNDGKEQSYRVVRRWHANGNGVKETVDVYIDGTHEPNVSESWAEYAEEFVPARLSHLFFFDGEKIEALADLVNAADVLRSGIHSLLGLDLVDRLHDDLGVVATRKEKALQVDESESVAFNTLEAEVLALCSQRDELVQKIGGAQSQFEQCQHRLNQVNEKLHAQGGELFRQKHLLENNRRLIVQEREVLDAALRELASGPAPFLLVPDLLGVVEGQARDERAGSQASALAVVLRDRDEKVLRRLSGLRAKKDIRDAIASFLRSDREQRTAGSKRQRYLNPSDDAIGLIHDLRTSSLGALQEKTRTLLSQRDELEHALVLVERKLSTVPEEDAIAPLEREREELHEKQAGLDEALARLREEHKRLEHDIGRKDATLKRLRAERTRQLLEHEDISRMHDHARRAQQTLRCFRERVVAQHLSRIQQSVQESLQSLLRKQSLVSNVRIDHQTYELELRDADDRIVSPDRLSAGERQLLAVALLWGLAKATRRPLPAIIDTPLGRLDSSHRSHLVERYFPNASHQVLLLSTDEEIRGEYLVALQPSVGRSYLLQYDEAERSSSVTEGYFTREGAHAD